jgi:hypothetical protein
MVFTYRKQTIGLVSLSIRNECGFANERDWAVELEKTIESRERKECGGS